VKDGEWFGKDSDKDVELYCFKVWGYHNTKTSVSTERIEYYISIVIIIC